MNVPEKIHSKLKEYCEQNEIHLTNQNFELICKKALSKEEFKNCFLSNTISEKLDKLAVEGDSYFDKGNFEKAIEIYKKGINLIPKPQNHWEAKLWFTGAIADSFWNLKKYKKALMFLDESLLVEGGKENPFIRLRRGQVLFELSKFEKAEKEFQIGFELEGQQLFEEEDSKYLKFLKTGKT